MHDIQLEDAIRFQVALDALWIMPNEIDVRVRSGMVRLRGEVRDRLTEQVLVRMVRGVDGVLDVDSQLAHRDDARAPGVLANAA